MARLIRMPEVAANAVEAVLQEWQVEEGAAFSADTTLATIETDKAVVDIEAESDGVLLRRLVADGTKVDVGAPIAVVADLAERVGDLDALMASLGVGTGTFATAPTGLSGAEDGVPQPEEPAPVIEPASRIFSSPLARRLASEAGLDLAALDGTGPRGRILRRDVERGLAVPTPEQPPEQAPGQSQPAAAHQPVVAAGTTEVPHSRMRRAIAARLVASKQTVPHFYLRATLDVGELLDLRARVNEGAPVKVSVNDLVVKAAAAAHRLVPEMNAVWTDEAVRRFDGVDIAVAVATDGGLLTPVVRGVDTLSVTSLAGRTRDLAQRAKAGRLRQDELEGGSLSVTNLGMFGTEEFAAIINPPHAAILAVGAARQEPVVRDGALAVGTVMRVTMSVDHRPVDGVVAARWMRAFTELVENPVRILA